jgi:CDP-diacylglycerol--glycerol-3-phosphate 3-phosphatidyltransferase
VRILFVPVLLALILAQGRTAQAVAAVLFLLLAATDALDGYLARRHAMTTETGKWLDPMSDKLLVIAPIVVLSMQGRFPWWATAIIIIREAAVSGLRVYVGNRRMSMPASPMGKVKTVAQIIAIALYIYPGIPEALRFAGLIVALALTLYSGAEYFIGARALMERQRR